MIRKLLRALPPYWRTRWVLCEDPDQLGYWFEREQVAR